VIADSVGAENPGVAVVHGQLSAEGLRLNPHLKLRLPVGGCGAAPGLLVHQRVVDAVLRLGTGENETSAAESFRRLHSVQGIFGIFLLDGRGRPGIASRPLPSHMQEHVAGLWNLLCQALKASQILLQNHQVFRHGSVYQKPVCLGGSLSQHCVNLMPALQKGLHSPASHKAGGSCSNYLHIWPPFSPAISESLG